MDDLEKEVGQSAIRYTHNPDEARAYDKETKTSYSCGWRCDEESDGTLFDSGAMGKSVYSVLGTIADHLSEKEREELDLKNNLLFIRSAIDRRAFAGPVDKELTFKGLKNWDFELYDSITSKIIPYIKINNMRF